MNIEELAFKDRKILANLNAIDLLDIIEFLQFDRKQWINQFTQTHNESVDIRKEMQQLKDNWNKLKKIIKKKFVAQGGFTSYEWNDLLNELLDKMQELERSDNK